MGGRLGMELNFGKIKIFKQGIYFMEKDFTVRIFGQQPWLEQMITYAQNFEDVILRRALLDITNGFYIDIGGFDPVSHSVTKYFYDRGWSGINVEPNPDLLKKFTKERQRDINLGVAIGAECGTIKLHIVGETGLTSTLKQVADTAEAAGYAVTEVVDVEMMDMNALFKFIPNNRVVDFLKVDIEGAEASALLPYKFTNIRPRILVVENGDAYHQHLLSCNYLFTWFDGLNRWYVREEDAWRGDLIARPVNVFDGIKNIERF